MIKYALRHAASAEVEAESRPAAKYHGTQNAVKLKIGVIRATAPEAADWTSALARVTEGLAEVARLTDRSVRSQD